METGTAFGIRAVRLVLARRLAWNTEPGVPSLGGLPAALRQALPLLRRKSHSIGPCPAPLEAKAAEPPALEEEHVWLTGLGEGTHIVSLVKVDGAGDRRETLIPVMTVPVHS